MSKLAVALSLICGVAGFLVMGIAASAAPAQMPLPKQTCHSDGLVTVHLVWGNTSSGEQKVEVGLSPSISPASQGHTTIGQIDLVSARPNTTYYVRVVDKTGVASPIFAIQTRSCGISAPTNTSGEGALPACKLTSGLLASGAIKPSDLAHGNEGAEGVYEGEWLATATNVNNAAGTPVGGSVVVIQDASEPQVVYTFRGSYTPGQWKVVGNEIRDLNDRFRFTPQAGGMLRAEIFFQGSITSEGVFSRCQP